MSPDRKILIIEDDTDIAATMQDFLAGEGFGVMLARDGREALEQLESGQPPAVILLDLMMPRMDGYAFRSAQLAHPNWAGIPVVVCTADGHARRRAIELGAQGGLAKPFDLDDLLSAVQQNC